MIEDIKKQIFAETGEKLDAYSLAILKANMLANQKVIDSNESLTEKFKGSINTNHYNLHGLSNWKLFIFRWGWGIYIVLGLFALWGSITAYNTKQALGLNPEMPSEFNIIEAQKDGSYFISKENYRVTKQGVYFGETSEK